MDSNSKSEPLSSKIKDRIIKNAESMEAKSVHDGTGEDPSSRKRKRECFEDAVDWIRNIARDPCNPEIEPLPEKSKWKSHGDHLPWKQILLARDAMQLKKNVDKNQKMLPSTYDDVPSVSERLRSSQRLVSSAKDPSRKKQEPSKPVSSPSDSEENDDVTVTPTPSPHWFLARRKKKIPLGPLHQADLPEPSRENYESDYKWLGTKIWPLNKAEEKKNSLIERDPIGKGRQETCGCESPGSVGCVRFHVNGRRKKMKLELGSGFYLWRLNCIGEEVAVTWTKGDELGFEEIVKSNGSSSGNFLWDELSKRFCSKGREALVGYYFNVFILRRRALQNRSGSAGAVCSDDEEEEDGPVGEVAANSTGSILCSPTKKYYMK